MIDKKKRLSFDGFSSARETFYSFIREHTSSESEWNERKERKALNIQLLLCCNAEIYGLMIFIRFVWSLE